MLKLLVLVLIAYLAWRGLESVLSQTRPVDSGTRGSRFRSPGDGGPAGARAVESLVPCTGCGVHVPRSRALTGPGGQLFCSDDCRRRAAQSA
jgi:uncharacterized protein